MPGRNYTAGGHYRYGFNGQEKDGELNESITTALYWEYDSRIGRRWNVDPDERTDESPYLTFGGNPLLHSDPQGNFWITDHLAIDREAYRMVYGREMSDPKLMVKTFKTLWRETIRGTDAKTGKNAIKHLDNMDNAAMTKALDAGAYQNWDSHQLQDFYSHSNYVEILKENGVAEKDMVTLEKLDKNSDLYKDIMKKIRTETYGKDDEENRKHDHDGAGKGGYEELAKNPSKTPQDSKNFMAKDANGNSGADTKAINKYKGFKHPLHDTAKRLALEATVNKLQQEKNEKENTKQPPSNQ